MFKKGDTVKRKDGLTIFGFAYVGIVDSDDVMVQHGVEKVWVTTVHPESGFCNMQNIPTDELEKVDE